MSRTVLKWIASIGAGGLTTLVMALIVLVSNMDLTSAKGAALLTVVGTLCTWVVGYAVSKTGAPPPKASVRTTRRRTANGPNQPADLGRDAMAGPGPHHVRQHPDSP